MKKINLLILIISVLIFITVGAILYFNLKPKSAGLLIRSTPVSTVYVNGELKGKTPFTQAFDPGEVVLKLVPESGERQLLPFETKINLVSGIQTVVRREFGADEEESSGDVISFDKAVGETSLVVVSTPDNAQVSLDGVSRGFSPYKTSSITSGKHQITVKAPGHTERVMTLNLQDGYRLTVFVKLARTSVSAESTPAPTPTQEYFVLVLSTPTGSLRVRNAPGTSGEEIAEIVKDSKYKFLGKDEQSGWYKIQYQEPRPGLPEGIVGWVSSEYTKIVDSLGQEVTETPL